MRVGAADTKRADPGTARFRAAHPTGELGEDVEGTLAKSIRGFGVLKWQGGRNFFVFECEGGLDQAVTPARFEMAEVLFTAPIGKTRWHPWSRGSRVNALTSIGSPRACRCHALRHNRCSRRSRQRARERARSLWLSINARREITDFVRAVIVHRGALMTA